jgi:hypothetical protein
VWCPPQVLLFKRRYDSNSHCDCSFVSRESSMVNGKSKVNANNMYLSLLMITVIFPETSPLSTALMNCTQNSSAKEYRPTDGKVNHLYVSLLRFAKPAAY